MFSQPLEAGPSKINKVPHKKRNKRKKKNNLNKHIFKRDKRKQVKTGCPMSNWAENFAVPATWQLKHQVAYWKARAKSLEYENKVLHDIIRKRHGGDSVAGESEHSDSESVNERDIVEEAEVSGEDGEDFEVSEEFIQFLRANAKYKEDARLERERLKAMQENSDAAVEEVVAETAEDRQRTWEELYGEGWPRISTLEMSLHSHFINESDMNKPVYWPNIPLNLNS
ncbi:uncharacterized protein LOC128676621 [Plodia interpunctella]|uniref:uncharacterized protein LOC128676621 n=1 Tax=Plodia interpunctella TaxID=58824 RepID=UPI002367A99E|nr:uncharacterized protein LOC128676621 [Plodia interpunctella]